MKLISINNSVQHVSICSLIIIRPGMNNKDKNRREKKKKREKEDFCTGMCPRLSTPLCTGLSVLKCQATDKPKALILRRGPHCDGGPWTLSRLIQLCYNPLPTRPSNTPVLYLPTPSTPRSPGEPLSGVAEAEHAFVSNPVYDRGHTASSPCIAIFLFRVLNYYDLVA